MRNARRRSAALLGGVIAFASAGCGVGIAQSNSAKMGEALAFASAAAVAQVLESAAEQSARNNAPVTHASAGVGLSPCSDGSQVPCVTVALDPSQGVAHVPPADREMTDDELKDYVLGYVNGVRKLNGVGPVVRDGSLDTFAQAATVELSIDHRPGQYTIAHRGAPAAPGAELQGPPEGIAGSSRQDLIASILLRAMDEGHGGAHHDTLLSPDWRRLGVGLADQDGRTYVTIDFAGR